MRLYAVSPRIPDLLTANLDVYFMSSVTCTKNLNPRPPETLKPKPEAHLNPKPRTLNHKR